MYKRASLPENAAAIYIAEKDWPSADPLMSVVKSTKLHLQLAKSKEEDGLYLDACSAYEVGDDITSVVRLCVDKLSNVGKAKTLARRTKDTAAPALVAEYCLTTGDTLVLSFMLVIGRA